MSRFEDVFSGGRKREEPEINLSRRPRTTNIDTKLEKMLEQLLEGVQAVGSRLDNIERTLKEMKETENRQAQARKASKDRFAGSLKSSHRLTNKRP